jgi:hypothetical protein
MRNFKCFSNVVGKNLEVQHFQIVRIASFQAFILCPGVRSTADEADTAFSVDEERLVEGQGLPEADAARSRHEGLNPPPALGAAD